jgi:Uma2 family endonuclease
MPQASSTAITSPKTYLRGELQSERKHEYVDGQIVAMTCASIDHGRIAGNIFKHLSDQLDGSRCEPFISDIKVKTANGNYRYPDAMVVCDNRYIDDGYASDGPTLLVEVLSPSTRKTDLKDKLLEYINIPTLEEYMIVEQSCIDVTVYRKSEDWRPTHYFIDESITLSIINATLAVIDIYQRVENDDMAGYLAAILS